MPMESWREMITEAMERVGDAWSCVIFCTMDDEGLDEKFDASYGFMYGRPFTLWTIDRVYFPIVYDGAEWVASVLRNPANAPTGHIGSGEYEGVAERLKNW